MKIEILGSGCAHCKRLRENVGKACDDMMMDAQIIMVHDFKGIASYGVMATPALVVDGVVKVYGRVPDVEEIKSILKSS